MKNEFDYCSDEKVNNFIENGLCSIEGDGFENKGVDMGFIYLIDFGDGKTKIGFTKNDPRIRLKQLSHTSTIMPFDLKIVALGLCEEVRCVEKILHTGYRGLRVKGEWFDFSKKIYNACKLTLIEELESFSLSFCFGDGWIKWKPSDSFIKKYSENKFLNNDIIRIIDWAKNKDKYMKITSEWAQSLLKEYK